MDQQKVTVTLPKSLLQRLNKTIPSRKRSLFITTAIEKHLARMEQIKTLEESEINGAEAFKLAKI
ncbi:MAG: hypothetical protein R2880_03465 [Deinococcales bacterium]